MKYKRKVGFLHIPKCAGSALSENIFRHLGLVPTHISGLSDEGPNKRWVVKKKSLEMRFAQNNIFLSGHLTYKDMLDLNRDLIFTYLRDPLDRLISLWTYNLTRSESPRALSNDPSLIRHYGSTFKNYIKEVKPNGMSENLLVDMIGVEKFSALAADPENKVSTMLEKNSLIHRSLGRLDFVFTKSPQEPIEWLSDLGYFDRFTLPVSNKSHCEQVLSAGCTRDEFYHIVKAYTYLDYGLLNEANKMFYGEIDFLAVEDSVKRVFDKGEIQFEL